MTTDEVVLGRSMEDPRSSVLIFSKTRDSLHIKVTVIRRLVTVPRVWGWKSCIFTLGSLTLAEHRSPSVEQGRSRQSAGASAAECFLSERPKTEMTFWGRTVYVASYSTFCTVETPVLSDISFSFWSSLSTAKTFIIENNLAPLLLSLHLFPYYQPQHHSDPTPLKQKQMGSSISKKEEMDSRFNVLIPDTIPIFSRTRKLTSQVSGSSLW